MINEALRETMLDVEARMETRGRGRRETAVVRCAKTAGVLKVIVPSVISGLNVQTKGAPAFEIFLRRPLQICDSRLPESGRVSQVDRSAEFRERGQADLYRSGTQ